MNASPDKFDGAFLLGRIPYDMFWTKNLFKLPTLKWFTYMPDPLLSVNNFHPLTDVATTMPLFSIPPLLPFGSYFFINRMAAHISGNVLHFSIYNYYYPRSRYEIAYDHLMEDVVVGDGFIGIRDKKQDPQNVDAVIPPMRRSSIYYKKHSMEPLSDDYEEFLSE